MSQAKANSIQQCPSIVSSIILDILPIIIYFNESVVRWSNCEQFYLHTGQLLQLYYQTEDNLQ